MVSSKCWIWLFIAASLVTMTLCGCGGGGGESNGTGGGSVSGHIADLSANTPLPGITVTIGGRSAQTDVNGNFLVQGISPGTYTVHLEIPAGSGEVLPPNATLPVVTVFAGQTTELPDSVFLVDESELPPDPPS